MKKVLITGISGFIGNYLLKYKPDNIQLSGTYLNNKPNLSQIDLLKFDLMQVDTFISRINQKYDVVIHCAAEASLAKCEKDPELAFTLNTQASEKLAEWSAEQNSKFVFLSTDIVFDGNKGDYIETDKPQPINIYGQSKFEAEQKILMIHKNTVIARLALCLGLGLGKTKSFIDWFLTKLENNEHIPLYYDEFRTPVSAKFTALTIWEIVFNEFKGIIHLTGNNKLNRYDLGIEMLKFLRSEKSYLLKKETLINSTYPRPKDVSMKSNFLNRIIKLPKENVTTLIENIL